MRQYERLLIIPDVHTPYHDEDAVKLALKVVKKFKPNTIIQIGDFLDFYGLSRFDNKDPRKMGHLQEELKLGKEILTKFRNAAPKAVIYYLKGNHESRLTKYINNNAAEFHNMPALTIPSMLGLSELGIKWVESGSMMFHGMLIKHGSLIRGRSGYTATGELEKSGISGVSAHTHRLGHVYKTNKAGMFAWVEAGCLCDLNPDYIEGQTVDWQMGMAYGYYTKSSNKRFEIHTLPIINNKVILEGQEICI